MLPGIRRYTKTHYWNFLSILGNNLQFPTSDLRQMGDNCPWLSSLMSIERPCSWRVLMIELERLKVQQQGSQRICAPVTVLKERK